MLKTFRADPSVDPKRIYVTGHSNGGRMTYLLWAERGDVLAACAPSASPAVLGIRAAKRLPASIIAGEQDTIVPFRVQQLSINAVRRHLNTDASQAKVDGFLRLEKSPDGLELATYIFPGGHSLPKEAVEGMVQFFKRH